MHSLLIYFTNTYVLLLLKVCTTMDLLTFCAISLSILASTFCAADPIPCDLNDANSRCPQDHCCVRDEYLFSLTYCKAFGEEEDACVTKPSFFECPCAPNYYCKGNFKQGDIISHFGKCRLLTNYTTETPPTELNITESTHEETSKANPDVQGVIG